MITKLTHRYLNGETTAAEEHQLLQLLEETPSPTVEQKALMAMLKASPIEVDTAWLEEDESNLYDAILQKRKDIPAHHRFWPWISIAAVLVIVLGIGFSLSGDKHRDAIAYVYGQEVKDENEVLSMMESTMESFMAGPESDHVEEQLTEFFGK
ncbi:MAG: hypothetical protein J5661_03360 [Bacteroidaceae bacterium]|nr:hypothetical protein [Bacteroidaceae bacterium]